MYTLLGKFAVIIKNAINRKVENGAEARLRVTVADAVELVCSDWLPMMRESLIGRPRLTGKMFKLAQ